MFHTTGHIYTMLVYHKSYNLSSVNRQKINTKKFYNKCERFLRPYRTYFFMAFAYNEDRATQRCDSSAL